MGSDDAVRHARPEDAGGIHCVLRRSRRAAFAGLLPAAALDWDESPNEDFREWVGSVVDDDRSAMLVATDDGGVIGCAEVAWNEDTRAFVAGSEAELKMIHVDPDRWGEGVGTALLAAAIDAVPREIAGVALGVLVDNDRARGFYERRGFEQDGTVEATIAGERHVEAVYRRDC